MSRIQDDFSFETIDRVCSGTTRRSNRRLPRALEFSDPLLKDLDIPIELATVLRCHELPRMSSGTLPQDSLHSLNLKYRGFAISKRRNGVVVFRFPRADKGLPAHLYFSYQDPQAHSTDEMPTDDLNYPTGGKGLLHFLGHLETQAAKRGAYYYPALVRDSFMGEFYNTLLFNSSQEILAEPRLKTLLLC